jgi:pantoate--beta-alanine ligase
VSGRLVRTIAEMREAVAAARGASGSEPGRQVSAVGLIPTMGALHAGHGGLMEYARRESGFVVVSIFVNPIQFDQQSDYQRYPRTLAVDVDFCRARGVDIVFAPDEAEVYPVPQQTFVEVAGVTEHLCGAFRPGHFRGVTTVVTKLFNIVQPDRAYFGEKDAQQLAAIRRMAADLDMPVIIVEVPTARECDGLAISSRNQHLSPEERRVAPVLYEALRVAEQRIAAGERDPERVKREAIAILLRRPEVRLEYLEIVDTGLMQPVARLAGPVRVAGAIWLGSTRLIDNVLCRPPQ